MTYVASKIARAVFMPAFGFDGCASARATTSERFTRNDTALTALLHS